MRWRDSRTGLPAPLSALYGCGRSCKKLSGPHIWGGGDTSLPAALNTPGRRETSSLHSTLSRALAAISCQSAALRCDIDHRGPPRYPLLIGAAEFQVSNSVAWRAAVRWCRSDRRPPHDDNPGSHESRATTQPRTPAQTSGAPSKTPTL